MRIERITVRELPGMPTPFELNDLACGVDVILGPNGSGKSSLRRLVEKVVWPALKDSSGRYADVVFEDGVRRWTANVVGDRVSWELDGVPASPPEFPEPHLRSCFFLDLRELLADDRLHGDDPLLKEIRRGVSGFDREAISKFFAIRSREGRNEFDALQRAENELSEIKRRHEMLAAEEDGLVELEERLSRAKSAERELESLAALKRVVAAKAELAEVEKALNDFPKGMDVLRGKDLDDLIDLDQEISSALEESEELEREVARINEVLKALPRIPDSPPPDEILSANVKKAGALVAKIDSLARSEDALAAVRGKLESAAEALGATIPEAEGLRGSAGADVLGELARAADERGDAMLRVRSAELELGKLQSPADDLEGEGRLRGMIDALRDWLALPAESPAETPTSSRRTFSFAAASILLVAGCGLILISPWFATLAGMGLGLLLGGMINSISTGADRSGELRGADAEREALKRKYERLAGGEEVELDWERDSVRKRLESLETEMAELLLKKERAGALEVRRMDVEVALETEKRKLEELEKVLEANLKKFGFDLPATDLETRLLADRLRELFTALADFESKMAEVDSQRRGVESERADLRGFLEENGRPVHDDPALLEAEIVRLEEDVRTRRTLREKLSDTEKALEKAERGLRRARSKRSRLLKNLFLPEDEAELELRSRIKRLPEFEKLTNRQRELRAGAAAAAARLTAEHERLLDSPPSPDEIEAEMDFRGCEAEERDAIIAEMERVRNEIKRVASKSEIGEKTAAVELAREELREKRGELIRKAAAETLLARVEEEYRRENRPKVLKAASELFESFTRGLYKLDVATTSDSVEVVAVNTADRKAYLLSKLSDGTRIQLLLAMKTAFSDIVDPLRTVPLFLDEPLTTSDPERFQAVATALIEISERRQIIYLSSDPGDRGRWAAAAKLADAPEPNFVDLAAARSLNAILADPRELAPPPSIPAPAGMLPSEYAVAIGVEKIDLNEPATSWHIFHAACPDLDLCYEILRKYSVRTIGQWLTISSGRNAESVERSIGKIAVERLGAKAKLLAHLRDLLLVGRGKPFTALDAAECPAIKGKFRDAIIEIAGECGGDAVKFLEKLRGGDSRLKGVRSNTVAAIEDALEDGGFIDPRPPLSDPEIIADAERRLSDFLDSGALERSEIAATLDLVKKALSA